LPRTVVILGLVSFLNDAASEMITLLLPVFPTAILGLAEGVAFILSALFSLGAIFVLRHQYRAGK